jgi:hypothetical protein
VASHSCAMASPALRNSCADACSWTFFGKSVRAY